MARLPDLVTFAQHHGLKIGTISDLIAYRRRHDNLVHESSMAEVTSTFGGTWQMRVFADSTQGAEHIALSMGDLGADGGPVAVRMHALDPMSDVLGIDGAPGRGDLAAAMAMIAAEGRGVVVLLRDTMLKMPQPGEVSPQTLRQYGLGAQILAALGLHEIELLTNSGAPRIVGLDAYGLTIIGTRPLVKG